ncbi:hypothetical protein GUJ93_ZPchr0013g37013 [Zizania palustris]|uniref:VQ domain-containing protein n=1 Tax=Zizania palustris TaxID=103762 RepID=A0A8J5WRC2_ZIZPA|nr:hypothetical protein GUJ93_ZPchr0013g37013 [Zizania palustris]
MDDKLGVHHGHNNGISKPPVHHGHGGKGIRRGGGGGKGIKVVYISSPMKLTTSAEEFRAVVQELTGRDSNVAEHDLAQHQHYHHYSSFGRASSTMPAAAAGVAARAVPPTMATANSVAGRSSMTADHFVAAAGEAASVVAASPAPFQSMYDQLTPSYIYGHDYW